MVRPLAKNKDMQQGYKHNTATGVLEIVKYHRSDQVDCVFPETGYTITAQASAIRRGWVKDIFAITVHGVGVLGTTTPIPRIRNLWGGMLRRCYCVTDPAYPIYGGKGVTVCTDWHLYTNFEKWYVANYIEGCHMDKDLKAIKGLNKSYSPDTVTFMTPQENNKLTALSVTLKHVTEGVVTVPSLPEFCRKRGFKYKSFHNTVVCKKGVTRTGWSLYENQIN